MALFLALTAPKVTGPAELDVTFGEVHDFTIVADSNATLIYAIKSNQSGVFTMTDNATGAFQVNVNTIDISATYVVSDTNGMVTEFEPSIKLCHCANNGTCTNATVVSANGKFVSFSDKKFKI